MSTVSVYVDVDVDLDDYVKDISDRALIAEVANRAYDEKFASKLSEKLGTVALAITAVVNDDTDVNDDTQRILDRLAEEIASGDTANALDTLHSMFPSLNLHKAISFARRINHSRHLS